MAHVLTGPDHLSALATLSAVSDCWTSFFMGVRWGIGHSTGFLLVGVVLILRDYNNSQGSDGTTDHGDNEDSTDVIDMPDALSHFFESLVGFFMLFLGVYGFRRAAQLRHEYHGRRQLTSEIDDNEDDCDNEEATPMETFEKGNRYHDDPHHDHEAALDTLADIVAGDSSNDETDRANSPQRAASFDMEPHHHHHPMMSSIDFSADTRREGSVFDASRRFSAKSMAVLAGIIHGLAGPGGVLGVIPAVQLHNWKLATLYLGCFCISSTVTMGCFACFYGLCSSTVGRRTNLVYHIHCFSSSLSILVGITWLVLLSLGKLEDVFP